MIPRTTLRASLVGMGVAGVIVLLAPSAHAAVSTFSGSAVSVCDKPSPPSTGTSTGNGIL